MILFCYICCMHVPFVKHGGKARSTHGQSSVVVGWMACLAQQTLMTECSKEHNGISRLGATSTLFDRGFTRSGDSWEYQPACMFIVDADWWSCIWVGHGKYFPRQIRFWLSMSRTLFWDASGWAVFCVLGCLVWAFSAWPFSDSISDDCDDGRTYQSDRCLIS
jgi:hypothetical protein